MQGLADGYFILPYTIGHYLAGQSLPKIDGDHAVVRQCLELVEQRLRHLTEIDGQRTVDDFHRQLGRLMWEYCGMARNESGLRAALEQLPAMREEFWQNVRVPGSGASFNQELEKAGRVADFIELAELMCLDALHRRESCGGHFREESQTEDGEAKRDDDHFTYVAAWFHAGADAAPTLVRESLTFESVPLQQRSYK
jgi:succinate dehydrogenase / fumarate reductase flavoprotein subunit